MNPPIPGGHFLISRNLFTSAVWSKPPQYLRLFLWCLGKAAFEDGHTFKGHVLKRGELITTYSEMADSLAYRYNRATKKPSLKELRNMLSWLQSEGMILVKPLTDGTWPNKGRHQDFTRAYVGLLIFVVNYDTYQDSKNYRGMDRGRPSDEQGQIYKGIKNVLKKKNPRDFSNEISVLLERYSDQQIINQAFQAISFTRKRNRIAESVKVKILNSWDSFPVNQVQAGIKTYLEKEYFKQQGKDEKYLLGIIRNTQIPEIKGAPVCRSTGSKALDDYYRQSAEAGK